MPWSDIADLRAYIQYGRNQEIRGGDGDTLQRSWHIAELDDAGTPVRLAAAPADLTRVLDELGLGHRDDLPRNAERARP
ncbi:hypothetical protein [Streptomyces sp. NPDC059651]|uniref:hypothetical protein n=1 Tax=Streptomyces sp. NPDC059651 TaxID=3346897 RepID=UPI0036C7C871